MLIADDAVLGYLAKMERIAVRKSDLSPAFEATRAEAILLMSSESAEGRGSRSRLKFLRLLYSPGEASERARQMLERCDAGQRADNRISLDQIQKITAARKFVFREQLHVDNGVRSGYWVWAHKQPRIA